MSTPIKRIILRFKGNVPSTNKHHGVRSHKEGDVHFYLLESSRRFNSLVADACKGKGCIHGYVDVTILLYTRGLLTRDTDNCIKPILDACKNRLFDDDKYVIRVMCEKIATRAYKTPSGVVKKKSPGFVIIVTPHVVVAPA